MVSYKPYALQAVSGLPGASVSFLFRTYYNSAFKIDSGPVIEIYHKSKLVPGFETDLSSRTFRAAFEVSSRTGRNPMGL